MNVQADAYIEWKQWDHSAFGKFSGVDASYYAAETSIRVGAPLRVLEIGFGNGGFLGWVDSLGGELFGIETNPQLVARAREVFRNGRFFDSLEDPALSTLAEKMTHIVAFDVIEHIDVDRLPGVFGHVREFLARDGKFIVRFPNGDSPFGRITQHGDPSHVTTIGRHKLAYLAAGSGLTLLEIRAPALPMHGVDIAHWARRGLLKMGRYFVERLFSVLYFGGQRIPLDSNYTAVLVRSPTR